MARFVFILLLLAFITFPIYAFSQKKAIPEKSQNIKSNDYNDQLMNYVKQLNEDTEKHRQYLQEYYNQLLWTIGGIGAIIGLVVTVFGVVLVSGAKKEAQATVKRQLEKYKSKIKQDAETAGEEIKAELSVLYVRKFEEMNAKTEADFEKFSGQMTDMLTFTMILRKR